MGWEVKEYAWTCPVFLACASVLTIRSVQPPFGEKHTSQMVCWAVGGRTPDARGAWQPADPTNRRSAATALRRLRSFCCSPFFLLNRGVQYGIFTWKITWANTALLYS